MRRTANLNTQSRVGREFPRFPESNQNASGLDQDPQIQALGGVHDAPVRATDSNDRNHPHNYEILSGQLRLPGVPDIAEKEALKGKINSYGKTWHTWMTGMYQGQNDALPVGPATLQWSLNYDGEDKPGMVAARDRRMDFKTADERADRADLAPLARPQGGVDAMKGLFPNVTGTTNGVKDNGDPSTRRVPQLMMRPSSGGDR